MQEGITHKRVYVSFGYHAKQNIKKKFSVFSQNYFIKIKRQGNSAITGKTYLFKYLLQIYFLQKSKKYCPFLQAFAEFLFRQYA